MACMMHRLFVMSMHFFNWHMVLKSTVFQRQEKNVRYNCLFALFIMVGKQVRKRKINFNVVCFDFLESVFWQLQIATNHFLLVINNEWTRQFNQKHFILLIARSLSFADQNRTHTKDQRSMQFGVASRTKKKEHAVLFILFFLCIFLCRSEWIFN